MWQTFCLEHRVYTAHQCPLGGRKDLTITICPDCSLSVRTEWGKDVNQTLETHRRTSCDPSKLVNASRKMKCPVRSCRESLTVSNRVRCRLVGKGLTGGLASILGGWQRHLVVRNETPWQYQSLVHHNLSTLKDYSLLLVKSEIYKLNISIWTGY